MGKYESDELNGLGAQGLGQILEFRWNTRERRQGQKVKEQSLVTWSNFNILWNFQLIPFELWNEFSYFEKREKERDKNVSVFVSDNLNFWILIRVNFGVWGIWITT